MCPRKVGVTGSNGRVQKKLIKVDKGRGGGGGGKGGKKIL